MISKEEVKHIAKLARLGLSEKELEKYRKELSSILDYIEKLKEVDVSGTEPTSHPLKVENITRKDGGKTEARSANSKILLEMAPDKKEGYVKVKQILNQ